MFRLKKILLIVMLFLSNVFAGITVIESTPSRLVLEWEMSGFDTVSTGSAQAQRTHVSFNGGLILTTPLGSPNLPGYSIHLGVPQTGAPRASVEPVERRTVRLNSPIDIRERPNDPLDPVFRTQWISEPMYNTLRDYRTAHFVLRPIISTSQNSVELLTKARIVIDIPQSANSGMSWSPRDDYERMVSSLILNFRVAQGWQTRRNLRRVSEEQMDAFPFSQTERLAKFTVGDGNRNGNEGTTNENTLIKISGSRIREIFGSNGTIAINSVSLFASHKGEMSVNVPYFNMIPSNLFEVPMLRYDINGNGVVDNEDYFIAYVSGANDWGYSSGGYSYTINRYSDHRTYWLSLSGNGLTMEKFEQPASGASANIYETFEDNLFLRTPNFLSNNNNEGGINFGWRNFTIARADTTIRLTLTGLDASQAGTLRVNRGDFSSGTTHSLSASLGSTLLCSNCANANATINSWDSRDLTLRYTNSTLASDAFFEVNSAHLRYQRFIRINNNEPRLEIFSQNEFGAAQYRLANTANELVYIVHVPSNERNVSLIDTTRAAQYVWSDNGGTGARYMAILKNSIVDYSSNIEVVERQATSETRYQIRDVRNPSNRTDYLIITHAEFLDASIKLARHKESVGFSHPKVVLLDDILNSFGGGNIDPAAIRNFLLYVYRHWQDGDAFSYVVLFGSGHYDYKHVNTRAVNFMPIPYISNRINDDFYSFFDMYVHVSNQHDSYYFMGRMPAKSGTEANDIVDKIIELEDIRVADFGAWRNRVLLSADDDQQGSRRDPITTHHRSSDRMADSISRNRPEVDIRKLYLYEFEWDERYHKPDATRTLINEINGGIALFNWFGHGSPNIIADERLFLPQDISALHNRGRYPIISLFSCSIGKFDHANQVSLGEMFITLPRAGAAAVVSAAREVYDNRNEALAAPFFGALFSANASENPSLGSALKIAKVRYPTNDNRYYVILGDPSINLFRRHNRVRLTITDSESNEINQLKALQQVTIRGVVQDPAGNHNANFGGNSGASAHLTLFGPPQTNVRRKDGGTFTSPTYTLPGVPVFSARVPVINGEFEQQLLLPMNLPFGTPGVTAVAYVWNNENAQVGAGHRGNLIFEGSEVSGIDDTTGPRISVRPVFGNSNMDQSGLFVRNRITSRLPLTLEISVEDDFGINVMSSGPDEGLTAEVRGSLSKRSINHQFLFTEGSFRHGTATLTYQENSLRSGQHELIISAQNLLGNVSKLSVILDIVDQTEIKLDNVINVPNPVRMGRETRFFFHHSDTPGDLDMRITIRVYTLGGRLLAVIRDPQNGQPWVPRDARENLLTPNVYLYQITASSPNLGKTVKSKVKKLVVHPPR